MVQPLFIEPVRYLEKKAVEMRLPEDPNKWPTEILQELYKQVPYVADFEPQVEMDRADGEKGYGFGHISISNQTEAPAGSSPDQLQSAGVRNVRVPIVVHEGMLQPLDLLVTDDSKLLPLTEKRLRQAIFRPQAFDVTARTPGDQSMIGQLYPPYRQNYGMGGGGIAMSTGIGKQSSAVELLTEKNAGAIEDYFLGHGIRHGRMGKKASWFDAGTGGLHDFINKHAAAENCPKCGKKMSECSCSKEKKASLLQAILPTINEGDFLLFTDKLIDRNLCAAFAKNAAASVDSLKLLLRHDPRPHVKLANISDMVSMLAPTVGQLVRCNDGQYLSKIANHTAWRPTTRTLDRREAIGCYGEKVVLAADMNGSVTMGYDSAAPEQAQPSGPRPAPITDYGFYKVCDMQGGEHVGVVIPNLVDTNGKNLPIALFTNGSVCAVQTDIVGTPAGQVQDLPASPNPSGHGFFFKVDKGKVCATIPLSCNGSTSSPGEPSNVECETFDGRPVTVSQQPNIQMIMPSEDGKMLIPMDWRWCSLDKAQSVDLAGGEEDVAKEAQVRRVLNSVTIRSGGGYYDIDGLAVTKLAEAERQALDIDRALFLLVGLGVHPQTALEKVAMASTGLAPVSVSVKHPVFPSSEREQDALRKVAQQKAPELKRDLVKEAAFLTDPTAVDTVLSIGFINPENIMTFVSYLPEIDEAQQHLCELCLASRLGMSEVPTGAVEKAIKSLEQVIEGLQVLAFTGS
jgi:hypothetical protein